MSDLVVEYEMLDDAEQSIHRIVTEFESCTQRRDQLDGVWGSHDVAHAMRDFVDNWDRHRKQLVDSLKNVGEMCAATKQAFLQADSDLANKLKEAGRS